MTEETLLVGHLKELVTELSAVHVGKSHLAEHAIPLQPFYYLDRTRMDTAAQDYSGKKNRKQE